MSYDVDLVRKDFPILERRVHDDQPLVYLDSANTSQKPRQVVEAIVEHYERHNANIHRAQHVLAEEATAAYEGGRDKVAGLIKAPSRDEVVFTKNASEALNLVANTMAWKSSLQVGPGDEIVITEMEHHSTIVPWQLLAQRTGATLRWFGLTDGGRLDLSNIDDLISDRTKVVSLVHVSNTLGTLNPVAEIAARAHEAGAVVVVDGSQAAPQLPVDVTALGADFYAFTGHKLCGPTGIGVLWGKAALLDELPPFLGGGEMIETVAMTGSTYAPLPYKFEAGTMPIAQSVGLGAAVDYITGIGLDVIAAHEQDITAYALERLHDVPGLRIVGPDTPVDRGGAVSFTLAGVHPHDVAQVLDSVGVAVRAGHHCAKPVCDRYGIPATTRASFYLYTTRDEVDALVRGLDEVRRMFL
ncbi:MAG TPA: cysteine desulfurase [Mycobacteriales bacterium]|nr:cysteine desulfurase [Mycobacteriales bacterium]